MTTRSSGWATDDPIIQSIERANQVKMQPHASPIDVVVAQFLIAVPASADRPAWLLYAIHRTGPTPAAVGVPITYLVEAANPATGEVRTAPTLAAYHHLRTLTPVV